ncbi:hypothetical protein EYR15_09090 [Hansschlegelia quercus]|uniref:Protein L n=1 Tax=Hansschlegelia quercus TaxID=2528245 RepID=A0A4V6MTK4_9HYPH|nr:hypothetical protein EYR15_09090 [Hansschlegelia quercus]
MALYQDGQHLTHQTHSAFDADHSPGTVVSNSGVYRCIHCGDEIAANKGNPLPPQNHHQHRGGQPIRWRLLVCTVQQS